MQHFFNSFKSFSFSSFWSKVFTFFGIAIIFFTSTGLSQTWTEDWEGNWSTDWHITFGTWEVGIPTSGPGSAYNGQNCAATILNGNYGNLQ